MKNTINPNDPINQLLKKLYLSGVSSLLIGKQIGLSQAGIYYRLAKLNIKLDREHGGKAIKAYQWGKENDFIPINQIHKQNGRSYKKIIQTIQDLNIKIHYYGRWKYISKKDSIDLLDKMENIYKLIPYDWQGVVSECDMGWLGGIWDGEGTISMSGTGKTRPWSQAISILNTDKRIIEKVEIILNKLKIKYRYEVREPKNKKHKTTYRISILYCPDVWRFCREIKGFLIAKQDRAKLMMEFEEIRSKNARRGMLKDVGIEYSKKFDILKK